VKAQFAYSSPHKVLNHKDIRVEFTGKNLTKFGGINLVRKFLTRLKIKEELARAFIRDRIRTKRLTHKMG